MVSPAERLRQEFMPTPEARIARSAWTSYTAGWLREHGVRFENAEAASRAARGLAWARWLIVTGRIERENAP